MYSFVKALLKPVQSNTDFTEITDGGILLKSIINDYSDGYFELSNPLITGPIFVTHKELLRSPYGLNPNQNIVTWLTNLGDLTIEGSEFRPIYNSNSVLYESAWVAGYTINLRANVEPLEGELPDSERHDLSVEIKSGVPATLHKRSIFSVNGFFHRSEPTKFGVKIIDGGLSGTINNDNRVGIYSFANIGDLEQIRFNPETIVGQRVGDELKEGAFINTGRDLTNKTVLLVIGGFLHALDGTYKVINPIDGVIRINIDKLDPVKQISRSYKYIDLSALGIIQPDATSEGLMLDTASDKPGTMNPLSILSDRVLRNYLTIPQSFMLIVDTPYMIASKIPVENSGLYGTYNYPVEPVLPMVDVFNRVQEYTYRESADRWVIDMACEEHSSRLYQTINYKETSYVNNLNQIGKYQLMDMDLLDIRAITISYEEERT